MITSIIPSSCRGNSNEFLCNAAGDFASSHNFWPKTALSYCGSFSAHPTYPPATPGASTEIPAASAAALNSGGSEGQRLRA